MRADRQRVLSIFGVWVKARGTPRIAYTRGRETDNVGGNADYTPSHDSSQGRSFLFPSWQSEHEADGASVRLHKTAEMRTRPRLSDNVAKLWRARSASQLEECLSWQSEHEADGASVRLHKTAEMRTRPRRSDKVAELWRARSASQLEKGQSWRREHDNILRRTYYVRS